MDRTLRRLATALVVGAMAPLFDSTIVSVALHGLARDLDAPVATIQWVSTAYLLAVGVVVPVAGGGCSAASAADGSGWRLSSSSASARCSAASPGTRPA